MDHQAVGVLTDRPGTRDDADARASRLAGAALQRGRRRRTRHRIVSSLVFLVVASGFTVYWAETEGPLRCVSSSSEVQAQLNSLLGWMLPAGEIGAPEGVSCGEPDY